MAMLREEFGGLSIDDLKKLIHASLDFIDVIAPFNDTRKIITDLTAAMDSQMDKMQLQSVLVNLLKVIVYWDAHKDQAGYFKKVERAIINEMLQTDGFLFPYHSNKLTL